PAISADPKMIRPRQNQQHHCAVRMRDLASDGDESAPNVHVVNLPPAALGMLENEDRDNVYYSARQGSRLLTGYDDLPAAASPPLPACSSPPASADRPPRGLGGGGALLRQPSGALLRRRS